uniref:Uncharacterized protein n=1 Tax=Oryza nivara TaxID=4536 RepID=A0A0E0J8A2_ORYNI
MVEAAGSGEGMPTGVMSAPARSRRSSRWPRANGGQRQADRGRRWPAAACMDDDGPSAAVVEDVDPCPDLAVPRPNPKLPR